MIVKSFMLRAPLLRFSARSLDDSPLGRLAVELASPGLPAGAAAALRNYTTRARFRATPAGLLAGVGMGRIGRVTRIDTGEPEPRVTVGFERLAALARALVDDPRSRRDVRLRVAPSLLRHGDHLMWLSPRGQALEAVLDEDLERIVAGAAQWIDWPRLSRVAPDELIVELLDGGLLLSDLLPPLVGPPPLEWMLGRLARMTSRAAARARRDLARVGKQLAAGELAEARRLLAGLPGGGAGLAATLVFPHASATLAAAAVERAAALAPLLLRLAQALAPPSMERALDASIEAAVAAAAELCGPGAYDLGALALGGYGVRPGEPPPRPAPPILPFLIERLWQSEIALASAELEALLPPAPIPDTIELMLSPHHELGAPGSGWLLGLHAPAGASWGRFAHALGEPARRALAELARAEPRGRLDVLFAPGADLGDLAAHPPVRPAALALSGWPEGAAVTPSQLAIAGPALELIGGTPSPLSRVRSTLAPPGVFQLLCGWSLLRQHAPWALAWGALADQLRLPRVRLDGFVIAPASWRLPARAVSIADWRRRFGVPRWIQVGHEDELLLVDLEAADAAETLARLGGRAHEVWPPADAEPLDASGRRVEVVVAVVLGSAPLPRARRAPPPAEAPAAEGWRSFRIYGPADRQDRVLLEAVAPAVAAARAAGAIDAWFFLRYVEGGRHQLRVRARGELERALGDALQPAIAAGDVVTVETGPYHRELARYGRALPAVEELFEADSDLALALLAEDGDPEELALRSVDALAGSLGLGLEARARLAAELRAAHEPYPSEAAADFRRRSHRLRAALSGRVADRAARLLAAAPRRARPPRQLVPVLLHLAVNRLVGTDADQEGRIAYLWQRTLEGLLASGGS